MIREWATGPESCIFSYKMYFNLMFLICIISEEILNQIKWMIIIVDLYCIYPANSIYF